MYIEIKYMLLCHVAYIFAYTLDPALADIAVVIAAEVQYIMYDM